MDVVSLMRDTGTSETTDKHLALVCIDIFSKKAHVVPLENKLGDTVFDAFMECFKVMGYPNSTYSDDESTFMTNKFQDFLKAEGIEHVITFTHANVAERFVRTIKKDDCREGFGV